MSLNLTPDDALDALAGIVRADAEIERLEERLAEAKETVKEVREELRKALDRRARSSRELRAPDGSSLPLGAPVAGREESVA